MREQKTNVKLCCALYAMFFLGNSTIYLATGKGVPAAIFGLFLAFVVGAALVFLTFKTFEMDVFSSSPLGIVFGIFFILFALLNTATAATDFSLVTKEKILPSGNHVVFALVFSLVIYFILKSDKKVLFKISLIFLTFVIFSEITLFLTSLNQFDFSEVKRLSLMGIFSQFFYFFSKSIAPLILLPILVGKEKSSKKGAFYGILFALFLILLPLAQILLIFGPSYAETLQFPFITVLDTVSIGLKFSRLEGLAFIIFFFGALLKCSVCLYCAKEIAKNLSKKLERFLPLFLSVFLFFLLLFSETIATENTLLNAVTVFCVIALMAVGLLKNHIHSQCKTK